MTSQSYFSFGMRLRKAQDVASYLPTFQGYTPPRAEESVPGFTMLCDQIKAVNGDESNFQQQYNALVKKRYALFRTDERCVIKLLVQIRGYISAQYGKKSTEYEQVMKIIREIRASRLKKTKSADGTLETSHSQSEQGYGAMMKTLDELIFTIQNFAGYNPSRHELQHPQLVTLYNELNTLCNDVATKYIQLRTTRDLRRSLYDDLSNRYSRIKSYVISEYGLQSREYDLLRKVKI